MRITKRQLRRIIREEVEAASEESSGSTKWPSEYPSDAPANLTTAELSPEEFILMIKDWIPGAGKTEEEIFGPLGGENKLKMNYANLKSRMESEGAGKLPRKYMPVVKKAFVEDLFNRLKAGKLDWTEPFAKSSKKAKGYKGDEGAGKAGRIKKKKTRKAAKKSIEGGGVELEEQLTRSILRRYIRKALTEKLRSIDPETGEEFVGYGRGDYSEEEREEFAEYLPSKQFPSLGDFDAMPDPKKSKDYWLNKGELDGKKGDDILKPKFGTMSVAKLQPSQDRVYADKIGWKLLQYGPNKLAPLKDPDLIDPNTGEPSPEEDWRYRSIVIQDGMLLDGHHKWALSALSGPNSKVPVLFLPDLDLATTINLLRAYGAAQGFAGQA